MRFGLQLGYWGAAPPSGVPELLAAADEVGFDAVFTAESWGSDAFTPLSWWGRDTGGMRLGTSVVQMSARTPTATAMHALTLDHLSGGRFILGLGVSGPQVVEGWYGQPFARPLERTREYVDVVRQVLARERPVAIEGRQFRLPYDGENATGLGKPLRPIVHPLRADLPIWIGAEGPKNVAQTAEIADGWLATFYSPTMADTYNAWLDEGFARPGARRAREEFEVAAMCVVAITDDPASVYAGLKTNAALYIGGMGATTKNFHADVYRRMGFAEVVDEVTRVFRTEGLAAAAAVVPDEVVAATSIVGDAERVGRGIAEWEACGVDMLIVTARTPEEIRALAPVV